MVRQPVAEYSTHGQFGVQPATGEIRPGNVTIAMAAMGSYGK